MPTAAAQIKSGLSMENILAPLSVPEFLDTHWQKEHLFLKERGAEHYGSIFGFTDIDRYLTVAANNPSARMALGITGEDDKVRMTQMRVQDVQQKDLFKAFHSGSTIMLDSINQSWPAAAELAALFSDAFSALVKVNAYITPPGFQGAPIHPDIQDVFALQMEGSKEWYIFEERTYEPVENLTLMDFIGKQRHAYPDDLAIKEKTFVYPGDLLYIPRGLVHKAVAPSDSPSIHLAVCVTPFYWVDFMKAAVEVASTAQQPFSDPLPVAFDRSDDSRQSMRERFSSLIGDLDRDEVFERTLAVMRQSRGASTMQVGDGHLKQIVDIDDLDADTVVTRRSGHLCSTQANEQGAVLIFGPNARMGGPPSLKEAYAFICDNVSFRIGELPGPISESSKVTVIKRLIRDGLLRAQRGED